MSRPVTYECALPRTCAKTDLFREYAVDPAGNIRTLRFHVNVSCGLLLTETNYVHGRPVSVTVHGLKLGAQQEGWVLLRDLYEAEQNENGWRTWLTFQANVSASGTRTEFNENFLPREAIRRREEHRKPFVPGGIWP